MNIALWSCLKQKGCVTTSTALMSVYGSFLESGRCVLLENHYGVRNLGSVLITPEQQSVVRESSTYFSKYGIEHVMKQLYAGEDGRKALHETMVPLLYQGMYYLPQSCVVNREVFQYNFQEVEKSLFQCLRQFAANVYIDLESYGNPSTLRILQDASTQVVICMDQDINHWEKLFSAYQPLTRRAFFILGGYIPEYRWNMTEIRKRFRIPVERIGAIPYNLELEQAMETGRLLQFVNRTSRGKRSRENAYFVRKTKECALRLHEYGQKRTGMDMPVPGSLYL